MTFTDLSFSRAPRTQLNVRRLDSGGLKVTTWNMVAEYEPSEFRLDPIRNEIHLVNSRGESWTVPNPV